MHTFFFSKFLVGLDFLWENRRKNLQKKLVSCFFFLIFPSKPWCGSWAKCEAWASRCHSPSLKNKRTLKKWSCWFFLEKKHLPRQFVWNKSWTWIVQHVFFGRILLLWSLPFGVTVPVQPGRELRTFMESTGVFPMVLAGAQRFFG